MLTDKIVIYIYDCFPVNCAEMQKQPVALDHLGKIETALVPQGIFITDHTAHS